ncbi:MAG TPA: hypothetical protein VHB54_04785 [Mucilaginibacter sp.]|nr:hypothetical protein [Mucilaginibacter sp.]
MTEEERIILHSLKFIKRKTKYNKSGHVDILSTLWKDWDDYKQNHFHDLLWHGGYVHLNPYPWELQLTDKGDNFIKEKDKELEESLQRYLIKERDVRDFMIANFIKPNDISPDTTHETDDGVVFLKELKFRKLINYDDGSIEQINNWTIPKGDKLHKRWFDNMTGKFIVKPINQFREDLSLDKKPTTIPVKRQTTLQAINKRAGTLSLKILNWMWEKISTIILWTFISVVAGLLIICIVNWAHHKGFTI